MSKIELDSLMLADQRDGLFEYGEHAEAEQIDFDNPQIGAIVLVPLDHHPAWHGGRFERHEFIERLRRDHHAAAVLAEMARNTLYLAHQLDQHPDVRRVGVNAAAS